MPSNTIARTYNDGLSNIGGLETITSDTQFSADIAVPAPSTNKVINLAFTQANLKSLCLYCDRAITLYTNAASTGSPQDTIALLAGQANVWSLAHDLIGTCPFSDNVTVIYATLASGAAATLKIRAIADQTP